MSGVIGVEANASPIQIGDKFKSGDGVWEVFAVRPFGKLSLACRSGSERGMQIDETCQRVRTWKRVSP